MASAVVAFLIVAFKMYSVTEGSSQHCSSMETAICYRSVLQLRTRSVQQNVQRYQAQSYTTYYKCGLWDWGTCSRTSYRSVSHTDTIYITHYYRVYVSEQYCCIGFGWYQGSCKPVCNCTIDETCIAPNTCRKGMELRLNGFKLSNNTFLDLSLITPSCETLACTTDQLNSRSIQVWYFPNDTEVGYEINNGFYVSRGSYGELYLHRQPDINYTVSPGMYCCGYHLSATRHLLCVEIGFSLQSTVLPEVTMATVVTNVSLSAVSMINTIPAVITNIMTMGDFNQSLTTATGNGITFYIPIVLAVVCFIVVTISLIITIISCRRRYICRDTRQENMCNDRDNRTKMEKENNQHVYDEIPACTGSDTCTYTAPPKSVLQLQTHSHLCEEKPVYYPLNPTAVELGHVYSQCKDCPPKKPAYVNTESLGHLKKQTSDSIGMVQCSEYINFKTRAQ